MPEGFRVATAYVEVVPDTSGFKAKAQGDLDREHLEAKAKVTVDTASLEKAKLAAQKAALQAAEASDKEAAAADKAAAAQKRAADAAEKLSTSVKASADAQKAAAEAAQKHERGELSEAEAAKAAANAADKQAKAERDLATAVDAATKADRENERASIAAGEAKLRQAEAAKKAATAEAEAAAAARGGGGVGEREERIKVKVDDAGVKEKLAEDKAAADSAGSSFAGIVPHIGLLEGALLGAVAALPAFGGALAAVGGGIGVLALAFGGVKTALSDYSQSQQQAAQAGAQAAATAFSNAVAIRNAEQAITDAKRQAAEQQISSAEAIRNAEQSLADARRQAAQSAISSAEAVGNAEQSLANAQINEQRAQRDLTQARIDAARALQQLNDEQKDATLGVQDAQLALQEAEIQQKQTNQNTQTTALQRAEADLAVAKAQQALKEAQERATNATTDATKANKLGVENSKTVQDAKNAERLAVQAVANAQQSLGDAVRNAANQQISSAEAIKKAEQGVADAQRNAANQQIASNEAVQKAVQSLADTQKEQQLQAATSGNQAAKAFDRDMANMSAAGRAFVTQLISMRGEFKSLSQSVQSATLPGFTTFLRDITPLIPAVTSNLAKMGSTIGGQFSALGQFLGSGKIQGEIKSILDQGTQFIAILGPALSRMGSALLDLWSKSSAASGGFAKGLGAIADGFGGLFRALEPAAGAVGAILQTLGQAIGALGPPLGQLLATFMQGLAPVLQALLPGFKALAGALGDLLSGALKAIAPIVLLVAQNVSSLAVALSPVLSKIGEMVGQLGPKLQPLMQAFATAFGKVVVALQPLLDVLPQLVEAGVKVITVAVGPLTQLITAMTPVFVDITKAVADFVVAAVKPLLPHMATMTALFGQILTALLPVLPPLAQLGGTLLVDLLRAITPILPALERFLSQLIIAGTRAILPLLPQIQQLSGQFVQLLQQLMPLLPPTLKLSMLLLDLTLKVLPPLVPAIVFSVKAWAAFVGMSLQVTDAILRIINWVVKLASEWRRWFGDIWNQMRQWWSDISNLWRTSTDWLYNTIWKGWTNNIRNAAGQLWNDLRGGVRTFFSDVESIFSSGVSALGTIWNRVEGVFKDPVNFLISTVYMGGIRTLWDDIVGAIGLSSLNLPKVSTLNSGGRVPGPDIDRDIVPALLTPGERVLSRKQVAMLGGHDAIDHLVGRSTGPSDEHHFAGGGIIGTITGGLSSIIHGAQWLTNFMLDPAKVAETLLDKVVSTTAKGEYGQVLTAMPKFLIHKMASFLATQGGGAGAMAMVNTAKSQIGVGETPPGSNITPYGAWFGMNGVPWCAEFVDWVAAHSGNGGLVPHTAGAGDMAMQFGSLYQSGSSGVLPGDIVFYAGDPSGQGWGGIGHVGIAITGGPTWQSVEGNSGDRVANNTRSFAIGHARPKYPVGGGPAGSLIHASPAAAKAWAQQALMSYGWGNASQYNALLSLWDQESGWRWDALNASSGAYGIPQSLPADKMASAGGDWRDNAATQIKWGLGYIQGRYGSPVGAEAHEQAFNWYDQGGWLPPGMGRIVNATRRPEAVLTPAESEAFIQIAKALASSGSAHPTGGAGLRPIEVNFNGTQQPGPEQLAAIKHALASAVGMS